MFFKECNFIQKANGKIKLADRLISDIFSTKLKEDFRRSFVEKYW